MNMVVGKRKSQILRNWVASIDEKKKKKNPENQEPFFSP
jgi:hypothetical protein